MCKTKAVLVSISLFLLVAASFCIYQAHTENIVRHLSQIKTEGPSENEYKKFYLNGVEGSYLVDEDIVDCNSTWLYGGKRSQKYMWWN